VSTFDQVPFRADRPLDFEKAKEALGRATVGYLTISMGGPKAQELAPEETADIAKWLPFGLAAGVRVLAELERMRGTLRRQQEQHRPRPHAAPDRPGALCDACSPDGQLVAWPCIAWTLIEDVLKESRS